MDTIEILKKLLPTNSQLVVTTTQCKSRTYVNFFAVSSLAVLPDMNMATLVPLNNLLEKSGLFDFDFKPEGIKVSGAFQRNMVAMEVSKKLHDDAYALLLTQYNACDVGLGWFDRKNSN